MNPTTKRLIDANELRSKACSAMLEIANTPLPNEYSSKLALKMGELFQKLTDEAPTVDAEPVQNGRWGKYGKTRRKIVCSLCDCPAPFKKQKTDYHIRKQKPGHLIRWESNYCPNCGAKMDAEVEG